MKNLSFREAYNRLVQSLKYRYATDQAMHLAVGGEFEAFGIVEHALLIHYGLQPDHYVIDVGCGSGRLAKPLSAYLKGSYLAIDVIPDLVKYAQELVGRSDWRFEVTDGLHIPERDDQADMVCFFSVFTHLLHEQSYVYLKEAKRVLKAGGKIIFSFLDFSVPCHWTVFERTVSDVEGTHPLSMFLSRDAIGVWAKHLDLQIEALHAGDVPHVPLPHSVVLDDGRIMETEGNLGQSICVLLKR
jgi:SAM-dependent methyltransferase